VGRTGQSGQVTDWVFSIVDRMGELGVGLLILLENLVPPIPSEVVLPLAGFRAQTGAMNVVLVWIASTAGSVLGALVLYALGAWLGYERLQRLSERPWFVITSRKDLERGRAVFERHGRRVVLLARFVPFLRSVVSIPAGVVRMPLVTFVTLTAIGSGLWNAAFVALGWVLGDNWTSVQRWLGPVGYLVIGLLVIGLVVLVVRRARARSATG
jgi:membrane protein DedA with SNARE-associated domain